MNFKKVYYKFNKGFSSLIITAMKKIIYTILILSGILLSNPAFAQVTFTDVGPSMGVNDPGAAQGVTFVDVNNDGWLDIFLVNNSTANKLWINSNGTSFTESSAAWGVTSVIPGRGLSAADFDNDGFVDVMIGNWQSSIILYKNTGTTFINYTTNAGVGFTSYGGAINWFDYNRDGKVDVFFGNDGIPPRYGYCFRNDNLLSFTNVAMTIGLSDSCSVLTLASADYDNDGDLDMFVGTQSFPGSPYTGILYKNNGDGTFTNVTAASGITTNYYTWGSEWGDFNNDGFLDLYLANTTGFNQLYKNNGNGTFVDVGIAMGVNTAGASYSCSWLDYDNDGDLDLYVARGLNTPDNMYRNDGTVFVDVASTIGCLDNQHSSCVSAGDFNNDGYLDLYVNNNGTANRLFKNNANSTNKWIIFKLQGITSNRSAIGSRVTIRTGANTQIREVEGGSGGKGQNSLPLEFGIGTATVIDSVIVRWSNGTIQRFANIVPNRIVNLIEGQPISVENIANEIPLNYKLEQNYPNPFNPSTTIRYSIPRTGNVRLTVFDANGREIAVLINERKQAGTYEFIFNVVNPNGISLPSGVYFYRLSSGDYTQTNKMILIR